MILRRIALPPAARSALWRFWGKKLANGGGLLLAQDPVFHQQTRGVFTASWTNANILSLSSKS
jgi:hypothetical protein